jgi:hypothetical protein
MVSFFANGVQPGTRTCDVHALPASKEPAPCMHTACIRHKIQLFPKYTTTMMMMNANEPPSPLRLPASAFFPSTKINDDDIRHYILWSEKEEDDAAEEDFDYDDYDYDDDTGSMSSLSTITTTCEAADDMIEFVAAFDHPCVVVYLRKNQQQQQREYYNTLQPHHHGGGLKSQRVNEVISTKVALLLLRHLEQSPPPPQKTTRIHDVEDDQEEEKNSLRDAWQANHHSYDSLPTFGVPDDENVDDTTHYPPLPKFLVSPRKGYHFPPIIGGGRATKRPRITTPLSCSPSPRNTFTPPVYYISVPNPLASPPPPAYISVPNPLANQYD